MIVASKTLCIALFTRSVKNYLRRACFCSFNVRWKFLCSMLIIKKEKNAWPTKFFTLPINRA